MPCYGNRDLIEMLEAHLVPSEFPAEGLRNDHVPAEQVPDPVYELEHIPAARATHSRQLVDEVLQQAGVDGKHADGVNQHLRNRGSELLYDRMHMQPSDVWQAAKPRGCIACTCLYMPVQDEQLQLKLQFKYVQS